MKAKDKEKNFKSNQGEAMYYLQGNTNLNDNAFCI